MSTQHISSLPFATVSRHPIADVTARRIAARVVPVAMASAPSFWLIWLCGLVLALGVWMIMSRLVGLELTLVQLVQLVPVTLAVTWATYWGWARYNTRPTHAEWWIARDRDRHAAVLCTIPEGGGGVKIVFFAARPRRRGLGGHLLDHVERHYTASGEPLHGYAIRSTAHRFYRDRLGLSIHPKKHTLGLVYHVADSP